MDASILQETPGFAATPPDVLKALIDTGDSSIRIDPDTTLYRAGDVFHGHVYLVEHGSLEQQRAGAPSRKVVPGYLLGLSSYFSDGPYSATVRALESTRLIRLPARALRELERRHPQLASAFDRFIGASLREHGVPAPVGSGALTGSVRGVMSAPLQRCDPDTSLAQAVDLMMTSGAGSLLISGTDRLVTWKSLAARLVQSGVDAGTESVSTAGATVSRIEADDPMWKAQDLQRRTASKYLLVEDEGQPVGMLSQSDVVRSLVARQAQLAAAVHDAGDMATLRARYDAMMDLAEEFLQGNRHARAAVRSLSEAHLAVQSRCIALTLEDMQTGGDGAPPAPFSLIIMGSGGRREMMLDPDQDNALILDDACAEDPDATAWFERFARALNENLDACGYILCPGDIMARNAMFRKTLSQWRAQVSHMSERPNEKAARWSSVVFDFESQAGDASLTHRLRQHVNRSLADRPRLLRYMVDDDAQGRAPLNWFSRLVATGERDGRETVDVKRNGLRMVANAARILALRQGIMACNTSERIEALARAGIIGADFEATLLDAYDQLLGILLGHQIRQRRQGRTPDKEVAPDDLTEVERESLRVSMRAVKRFQESLQDLVGGIAL